MEQGDGRPGEWAPTVRFSKVRMCFIRRATSGPKRQGVSPVAPCRCRKGQGTEALRFVEHQGSRCGRSRATRRAQWGREEGDTVKGGGGGPTACNGGLGDRRDRI